jgi:predicted SprT family Zn-dependent metalloprotease
MQQHQEDDDSQLLQLVTNKFKQLASDYNYASVDWNDYYTSPDKVLPEDLPPQYKQELRRISVTSNHTKELIDGIIEEENVLSNNNSMEGTETSDDEEEEDDRKTINNYDEEEEYQFSSSSSEEEDETESEAFDLNLSFGSDTISPPQQQKKKPSKSDESKPLTKHQFARQREKLILQFYEEFNRVVFKSKLPNMIVVTAKNKDELLKKNALPQPYLKWNKTLRKTAGITKMFLKHSDQSMSVGIELSVKVCDCVERLRKTLAHEMCHAATFLFHKLKGHGPMFYQYGDLVTKFYPDIPVTTCHSYEIQYKYIYQCSACSYLEKRHSKSVQIATHTCKICKRVGTYHLQSNSNSSDSADTSKINKYNLYIKANFARVKSQNSTLANKDLMKLLAEEYKKQQQQQQEPIVI